MAHLREEIRLQGVPISGGIAIGALSFFHHNDFSSVPEYDIDALKMDAEIRRYRESLEKSRKDLEELHDLFHEEGGHDGVGIIGSQLEMLKDPLLTDSMETRIREAGKNSESVFKLFIHEYMSFFETESDPEIHQRLLDVKDVSRRILKHLYPKWVEEEEGLSFQSIVCSYELVPSYTAEATLGEVQAFITEIGGSTSHTALIAKAKAIPYVSNIKMELIKELKDSIVIVDGNYGNVIVRPSKATIQMYQRKQRGQSARFDVMGEDEGQVKTRDGTVIDVQANVESLSDLDFVKRAKIKKIGLVRSEFLCMRKEIENIGEHEQYQLYKNLVQLAGSMEVVFRMFDLGSDKQLFATKICEPNPALGERSIRFLLKHRKFFATQVRAILRASVFGKVHLLLPLIADISELREAKACIYEERDKLLSEGIKVPSDLLIGCMVEVPAFVIMCDQMVQECDFLSIGTNDLMQYTLAIDRSNPLTSDRYGKVHPSIFRMIEHVVKTANAYNVPVSICGEIASNSLYTKELIELGVRAFSCAPRYIASIKKTIREVMSSDCQN